MKLNVRCCCQPTKILGTFEVPNGAGRGFMLYTMEFPHEPISMMVTPSEIAPTIPAYNRAEHWIQIKTFGYGESAVYSDDRPIEFWRRFPQFKEGDYVQW